MELVIGEKLKKLRRSRDLTQEEVATHLGISYQAISKWERGDGYPDITMLPTLANYFGVSVDELIGMDEIASASKLDEINQKWAENRSNGKHKENVALMRDALKVYPDNALLLMQLSTSLEKLDGTQTEKRKFLKDSLGEIDRELETLAQMLAIAPEKKKPGILLIKSAVLFDVGKCAEAEQLFRQVQNGKTDLFTRATADLVVHSDRARALGDYATAETYYRQILLRPNSRTTPLHLLVAHFKPATICQMTDRTDEVSAHYRYCAERGGETDMRAKAAEFLCRT